MSKTMDFGNVWTLLVVVALAIKEPGAGEGKPKRSLPSEVEI